MKAIPPLALFWAAGLLLGARLACAQSPASERTAHGKKSETATQLATSTNPPALARTSAKSTKPSAVGKPSAAKPVSKMGLDNTDHPDKSGHSESSDEIKKLIDQFTEARNAYLDQQKELRRKYSEGSKEERDALREQIKEKRQAFLEEQKEAREELRKRMAELKDKLKDHGEVIDAAKEDAKRRKGGGE